MYKKSLVILLSIFIIFTSHLAFSQNFDGAIPTAYAKEASFVVQALDAYYLDFNLGKGDRIDFTIDVRGGSGNDINLQITKPNGVAILDGGCVSSCADSITADMDGIYRFEFDNSFSIVNSKTVFIDYTILPGMLNVSSGCLIATAAFGSELAPQVQLLREIRDNTVLQTESGTSFMAGFNQFYYSFSPAVADYERENPTFKEAVKITLTPLLSSLTLLQYADIDTESEMLGYGIGVILLNIGMYFVAPAVLIMTVRKRI